MNATKLPSKHDAIRYYSTSKLHGKLFYETATPDGPAWSIGDGSPLPEDRALVMAYDWYRYKTNSQNALHGEVTASDVMRVYTNQVRWLENKAARENPDNYGSQEKREYCSIEYVSEYIGLPSGIAGSSSTYIEFYEANGCLCKEDSPIWMHQSSSASIIPLEDPMYLHADKSGDPAWIDAETVERIYDALKSAMIGAFPFNLGKRNDFYEICDGSSGNAQLKIARGRSAAIYFWRFPAQQQWAGLQSLLELLGSSEVAGRKFGSTERVNIERELQTSLFDKE